MKKALIIVFVLVIIGVVVYFSLFNKPHRDIISEKAAFSMPASELYNAFTSNPDDANAKYLNKVISVTGSVSDISSISNNEMKIVLSADENMFGVACSFSDEEVDVARSIEEGNELTIKGLCTGYTGDGLMPGDVVLVKCKIESD